MSSDTTRRLCSTTTLASASTFARLQTPPVGFDGVLTTIARVRGEIAGAEADDVDARGLELGGLGRDRERDRRLDRIEAGRDADRRCGHVLSISPWRTSRAAR